MRRRSILYAVAAPLAAFATRVRVGCQTRLWGVPIRERDRLLSIIDDLAALGYEGFETNQASLEPYFADPAPMRREFNRRRVPLIGLHASARLVDPAKLAEEHSYLTTLARAVGEFGGEHLLLSGPGTAPEALARRSAELNKLGEACRQFGVTLAVHNHAKELENDAEELKAVVAQTDPKFVKLLLDIAYVHQAGVSIPALLVQFSSRIAGMHVRDLRGDVETRLGEGEVNLKAMAEAMRQTRWTGWLILEMNPRRNVSSRELAASGRRYFREVMKF
jgi:sugar phosphate isomerase/epimerase